jgi:subtilisin
MRPNPIVEAINTPIGEWWSRPLEPVDVAVLDSGIDATHAELSGRILESYAVETVEGEPQWREVAGPCDNDVFGHGTAVAGIIAALAPNARIIDVRILGPNGEGSAACFLRALHEVVRRNWKVVNLSLALPQRFASDVRPLCEAAWHQGQILVSAKRNVPRPDLGLPAEFATSISVDTDQFEDPRAFRFQPGEVIEFVARGEAVTVAAKGGGYTTRSGTSLATPVMSGLCAVLLGGFPGLLTFEVRSVLKSHAQIGGSGRKVVIENLDRPVRGGTTGQS